MALSRRYVVTVSLASQNSGVVVSSIGLSTVNVTGVGLLTGPAGPPGAAGSTGATGAGVIVGGSANQAFVKINGVDFNTQWATIDKNFVGLGNVDNTSDADKVISTAAQVALDTKVDENSAIIGATKTKVTYDSKGLVTSGVDATQDDIGDGTTYRQYSATEKTKLASVATAATANSTDAQLRDRATHTGLQPILTITGLQTALDDKLDDSQKGVANGLAELDSGGLVPTSQLPAFVDDVIEVANFAALPGTGASNKIYITLDDSKTYRWSGSVYVEISASLSLGETSATAYRGDRGKIAYDHSQEIGGNPHAVTKSEVGLGSADNTSDVNKPVSTATQTALDGKQPLDADLSAIAALTSAANKGIQFTGVGMAATYDLTAAGKALLDDADATAQRTTLSLDTTNNVQFNKAGAGIVPVSPIHAYQNDTEVGGGAGVTVEQDGTGDAVIQFLLTGVRRWVVGADNSDNDRFKIAANADLNTSPLFQMSTGGIITLAVDLPVTEGGTGASTASAARTNLGVVIGTDVQPYNTNTTILGNTSIGTGAIVLDTSPTIITPTIASFINANHDHSNAAGGGQIIDAVLDIVAGTGIFYVSATGSDSNDGKTWGKAFATISKFFETINGGSTPTNNMGTLFVGEGTFTLSATQTMTRLQAIIGMGPARTFIEVAVNGPGFIYTGVSPEVAPYSTTNYPNIGLRGCTLRPSGTPGTDTAGIKVVDIVFPQLSDMFINGFTGVRGVGLWIFNKQLPSGVNPGGFVERLQLNKVAFDNNTYGILGDRQIAGQPNGINDYRTDQPGYLGYGNNSTNADNSMMYHTWEGVSVNARAVAAGGNAQTGIMLQKGVQFYHADISVQFNITGVNGSNTVAPTAMKLQNSSALNNTTVSIRGEANGTGAVSLAIDDTSLFDAGGMVDFLYSANFPAQIIGTGHNGNFKFTGPANGNGLTNNTTAVTKPIHSIIEKVTLAGAANTAPPNGPALRFMTGLLDATHPSFDFLRITNQRFGLNSFDGTTTRTYLQVLQDVTRPVLHFPQGIRLMSGANVYSGSGLPATLLTTGITAGDIYFRTDKPTTSSQQIYIATSPTTWTTIASGGIDDLNGNRVLGFTPVANTSNAINFVNLQNNTASNAVVVGANSIANPLGSVPAADTSVSLIFKAFGPNGAIILRPDLTGDAITAIRLNNSVSTGIITGVTLNSGGTGYAVNDLLAITTGNANARIRVLSVSSGVIATFVLLAGGSGYTVSSAQATSGGSGTGATFDITTLSGTVVNVDTVNSFVGFGGNVAPTSAVDVNGVVTAKAFKMTAAPTVGHVLTAIDSVGNMSWQPPAASASAISRVILTISSPTTGATAAFTDYVYLVSGTTTFTLPTAVGNTNLYTVKNIGTATDVTIATTGGELVDGGAGFVLPPKTSMSFISNNVNWSIVRTYSNRLAGDLGGTPESPEVIDTHLAAPLPVNQGGTEATDTAGARVSLGVEIGVDVQAYAEALAALSVLVPEGNMVPYFTTPGSSAMFAISAAGRDLVSDATGDEQLVTLGLTATATELNRTAGVTGPIQTQLDAKAPLASPAFTGTPTVPTAAPGTNTSQTANTAFVRTEVANLVAAAPGALDTLDELAAALGDDPNFATSIATSLGGKQPLDSDLTTIAGLTPADDDILQRKSGAWTNRTMAQLKTDLVLVKGDVGLGNAENTSDANKPVSTAQQTALDLKANLAGGTFGGDISVPDEDYDATTWNGSLEVPTKNAIRDKFEGLAAAGVTPAVAGFTTFGTGPGLNALNTTSGTSTVAVAGTIYWAAVFIPVNITVTGLTYTTGATNGAGNVILGLYNSAGTLLRSTALAGTAVSGSSLKQSIDLTSPIAVVGPGLYFIAIQLSATTAKFQTFSNAGEKFVVGSTTGSFGTMPAITPGTTYAGTGIGPYASTY